MNLQALKEAAERLNEAAYSYEDRAVLFHFSRTRMNDVCALADWALLLLSDATVTAEWLRDVWGLHPLGSGGVGLMVRFQDRRGSRDLFIRFTDGVLLIDSVEVVDPTKGRFTMLALGLGLTPKEGT
jgi:hypothetical protein